ncbi:MAG: hypothetical protein JST89_08410 [Cyanobacteria bacterium SZAS-4]|nr:hypothetical protein [Cyanobacteria bacterium SZAS-4]
MEDPDKTSTKIINAANQLIVGEIFDGKFEVFQFIDSGGMGSVYRVKHLLLNRELALMEFVCGSTLSKFLKTNGPQSWSACGKDVSIRSETAVDDNLRWRKNRTR